MTTTTTYERAWRALVDAGYSPHDRSPGPGLYLANMAPDSTEYDGGTEPGGEWDEECDWRLEAVQDIVGPLGCTAEWNDDDIVIAVRGN